MLSVDPPPTPTNGNGNGPVAFHPVKRRGILPTGISLPDDVWVRRHTFNIFVLAMHMPGIAAFALFQGHAPIVAGYAAGIIGVAALAALVPWFPRTLRATFASFGLLSCSALLVHLSGGYIEAHFHFFVMVPLIALYQSWAPFLLAFGYVAAYNGFLGSLEPMAVFNHPAAWAQPWLWAGIHLLFVAAASVASLFHWRLNEEAYEARAALARQRLEGERRVSAMRNHLLRTASHELKTPLTPLRLQVEMLASRQLGPLTPEQERTVAMLERNLERLGDLVTEALDVARLQDGRLTLTKKRLDLRHTVREAADVFRDLAEQREVKLVVKTTGTLPVEGDPNRLAQVLTNLVSNALKFTPAGGAVLLEAARHHDQVVLRVRDTGLGMTPDQIQRLFVPFGQVHEPGAGAERGTGLGLFISKGIVEAHGGHIAATSDGPGRGSTFTVRLPLAGAKPLPRPVPGPLRSAA